ncbi:hypothetical protein NKH73_28290 [Mesorhizobium sp. M0938]|uniref:hypothetical protein n=1 Tax=unclassified Mesorhizobium TaxID=325217 RepID=UPI003338CB82
MELLVNIANILYVIAYFTMDMLRLRLLTIVAACCLATYFYSQPEPMLNVVVWNMFFISLNMFQIFRILKSRLTPIARKRLLVASRRRVSLLMDGLHLGAAKSAKTG